MELSKCWKIVEFPKISTKIKKIKIFYEAQTASRLKKLLSPLTDKDFLRLWNKIFLREIIQEYTDICFQVLRECSSWASRNGAVQMFFPTTTRNMFDGKFVKWIRFLSLLREYVFYNVEWLEVRKMNVVFWAKIYCKISNLFC